MNIRVRKSIIRISSCTPHPSQIYCCSIHDRNPMHVNVILPYSPNPTQRSKDAVDNVPAERRTGPKDGRVSELLAEFLPVLAHLALRARWQLSLLLWLLLSGRDGHGRDARVVRVLRLLLGVPVHWLLLLLHLRVRVRLGVSGAEGLVIALRFDEDIVPREDTLQVGPHVSPHPPVLVHVLVDTNAVVLFKGQIAGVGGGVAVEGAGVSDDGLGEEGASRAAVR